MTYLRQFTAIIEKEDDLYVALCPELDIASQGRSVAEAKRNLTEALELFFEVASESEIETRKHRCAIPGIDQTNSEGRRSSGRFPESGTHRRNPRPDFS